MVWSMFGFAEDESVKPTLIKPAVEDETEQTVEEAFECDYEKSCTPLYKRIESAVGDEDWEPIVKFLDTGYWPGSLFRDIIAPQEQAKTWVTRFDPEDSSKVKWSQLPLHLAIVCGAPFKVIGRLVELYPQAVRCTDDQHMLPLHLSLRHNSTDEVVAYLLMQFPEAVNAKGKDNRAPIDCAMRAKDKLRGKILQIFVSKTKPKNIPGSSVSVASRNNKEVALLQASLNAKIAQLEEAQSKLADYRFMEEKMEELETSNRQLEQDLCAKVQELESSKTEVERLAVDKIQKLQDERLVIDVEHQKTVEELKATNVQLEESLKVAREEEKSLRQELEAMQSRVANVSSAAALDSLKEEVENLKAYRLQHSKSLTADQIDRLRRDVEKNLKAAEGKTSEELRAMQKVVDELRNAETTARTTSQLNTLREEVDLLREELNNREQASKTKLELAMMKKAMEMELKNSEGKTHDELVALRKAVQGINVEQIESKTNEELNALKQELETLKKEMKENALAAKTRKDVEELRGLLEEELTEARGATKDELANMKRHVDAIHADMSTNKSNDEILALKRELEAVKEDLRQNELAKQTKKDVEELKQTLEKGLMEARGASKTDLAVMMKQVDTIQYEIENNKSAEDIEILKTEIKSLKEEMKQKEEVNKMKLEMMMMKKSLEAEIRNSEGKTKGELEQMKKIVKSVDEKKLDQKSYDELSLIKNELETLKNTMKQREEADITKKELASMKLILEQQIKDWAGKTKDELVTMKKTVDALSNEKFESKNKAEWADIKSELSALKRGVKSAEEASKTKKELQALKSTLESELKSSEGKPDEELRSIHKAVEAIDLEHLELKNKNEWDAIRKELGNLKEELKQKEYGNIVLKKELEELKMSQSQSGDGGDSSVERAKRDKKGIRKFFSRWIKKPSNPKTEKDGVAATSSGAENQGPVPGNESDEPVETILPPSVARLEAVVAASKARQNNDLTDGSTDEEDPAHRKPSSPRAVQIASVKRTEEIPALSPSNVSAGSSPLPSTSEEDIKTPYDVARTESQASLLSKKSSTSKKSLKSTRSPKSSRIPIPQPILPDPEEEPTPVARSSNKISTGDAAPEAPLDGVTLTRSASKSSVSSKKSIKSTTSKASRKSMSSKSTAKTTTVAQPDKTATPEQPAALSPYEVNRTVSKTMTAAGDVEMSFDDEDPIRLTNGSLAGNENQTIVSF